MKCAKCDFDNPDDSTYCGKCAAPLKEEISVSHTKTLETPIEKLSRGTIFASRYEIIEELGKGGMGKVYRVEDKKIKEEVALKLIKPEIASDKMTIERFSNELKFARKIAHRNVCRMFDLGEEKGTHFITMEYVSGEDLKSSIRRFGQLPIGKSISIAKQICEGLTEAHRLGVIHRDLKPNNIMIDKEGNARIMDFGIARSTKTKGITGEGIMIGTPEYMSPEQVEAKDVDQRSDIYSLGVILYEMVTGRLPFEGDTPFTIGIKHKSEIPKNPKELNPQISDDLSQLILKCMAKDRKTRYQNVKELLSALSRAEKGLASTSKFPTSIKAKTEKPAKIKRQNSIAVLPFTDLSPQRDQEYFCDGIAEEIINRLTRIKDLQVVSRTSAFSFKGKDVAIDEIGKKLKIDRVLEGSVRKSGDKLRIIAQLINVTDGYHLWSERFDRKMKDIFDIQDEISLAIADNLKIELFGEEKAKLAKRYTENHEAYNLYLKARYFWNKRYKGGMQKGLEYFRQVIEKDPLYALAYVGIADSYNMIGLYGYLPPKEAWPLARAAANKALEIDNELSEAYASRGYISLFHDWNWPAAEQDFKRAIELNPDYAEAHEWYGLYLTITGQFDEAIAEVRKAHELDPLVPIINSVQAWVAYMARRFDVALEHCQKTIEIDPNFPLVYWWQGVIFLAKEMWDEAISSFQKLMQLSEGSIFAMGSLGCAYGFSGKRDEALKLLNRMTALSKEKHVSPMFKAMVYAGLGQKDKTIDSLENSYEQREPIFACIKVIPLFDSVRSDPRFTKLLKKMNLE